MFLLFESRQILAKEESVEGTDPTPTGAADAVLSMEGSCEVEYDVLERNLDRAVLGADPFKLINKRVRLKYTIDHVGAASVGTASANAPILKAAGHAMVLTGGVKTAFNPISTSIISLCHYFHWAGLLFKVLGARVNLNFLYDIDGFTKIEVEVLGFAATATVTEVAMPSVTLTAWREPPVITQETWLVTINGITVECFSLKISMQNELQMRHHSESRRIQIGKRSIEGTICIDPLALATLNPWALAEAHTSVPIVSLVDAGASNKVRHTTTLARLMAPKPAEKAKGLSFEIPFRALPSATGNDDHLVEYE